MSLAIGKLSPSIPPGVAAQFAAAESWLAPSVACFAGVVIGAAAGPPLNAILGWSFRKFNRGFDRTADIYTRAVGGLLRVSVLVLLVYGGLLVVTYWSFQQTPKGFIPSQDKGYLLVNVQLARLGVGAAHAEGHAADREADRRHAGYRTHRRHRRPVDSAERERTEFRRDVRDARRIPRPGRARACRAKRSPSDCRLSLQNEIDDGLINVFSAPPIDGLGTAGGFKMVIEDRGDSGMVALQETADKVVAAGKKTHELNELFTSFRANTPWLYLDIDRTAAKTMGVSISEVFNTLQVYLGSLYVNDFNRFGRTWQVNVQASADFRSQIEDLKQLKIRNGQGNMVPLATFAKRSRCERPRADHAVQHVPRRRGQRHSRPGRQLGSGDRGHGSDLKADPASFDARRMDRAGPVAIADRQHGHAGVSVGGGARLPGAGGAVRKLVAAVGGDSRRADVPLVLGRRRPDGAHLDINIFTQVGFVVLIGLACKNAILIVEFAKTASENGASAQTRRRSKPASCDCGRS